MPSTDPPYDRTSLVDPQSELRSFLLDEQAAREAAISRLWGTPLAQRIEEGRCLADLTVKAAPEGGGRLVLGTGPKGNDSRFREGDFVRLSRGDPQDPILEAMILRAEDDGVELHIRKPGTRERPPPGTSGLQLDESFIDLTDRYLDALEDLGRTAVGRERILPLLAGQWTPRVSPSDFEKAESQAKLEGLDGAQTEAVASSVATDLCWLVHGPPGTGKTRVLATIVALLVARGERIFVTSLTHRAIDNLLAAVAERIGDDRRVVKVSDLGSSDSRVRRCEDFATSGFAALDGGYVVGATPFALRSRRLRGVDFDTVVVDEASQVTLPLAVMAMLAGRRYIFAGDNKQLPPVVVSRPAADAVKLSVFGTLVGRGYDTMLTQSRRLNDSLCTWPSDRFYGSRLGSHLVAAARRLDLAQRRGAWAAVLARDPSLVWIAVPHRGERTHAPEEISIIHELLRELHDGGLAWREIGVVVPFRRQARLIRRRLGRGWSEGIDPPNVVIDTVERMQGQEREVVIVSLVVSDPGFALQMRDFLFQPQRINVAVTRARTKVIVVGSPLLLEFAAAECGEDGGDFVSLLRAAHRVDCPLHGVPEPTDGPSR